MSDYKELCERLGGYNPPDRTLDEQRQISQDIHDAKAAIERLTAENERLRWHAENMCRVLQTGDGGFDRPETAVFRADFPEAP